jgi:hypothetical protein
MGGQTAFGYEQEDGSVKYGLIWASEGPLSALERVDVELLKTAISAEAYFNKVTDIDVDPEEDWEDTMWRILYKLDGTTVCRSWETDAKGMEVVIRAKAAK